MVRCPQCGGDIDFLEETRVIHCDYCNSSLLVTGRRGVLRFVLPPRTLDPKKAQAQAEKHLRGLGGRDPRAVETFLFYVPFWRMQLVLYRWIFGQKPMETELSFGAPPPKERVKVLLTRVWDHTIQGYTDLDLGLHTLGVRSQVLQLRAFDKEHLQKRASFVPLEVPFRQAREEAIHLSEAFLAPDDDLFPEVILHKLVGQRFSVIYFPIWYVECRHGEKQETVLVDGVGGGVIRAMEDGSPILIKLMSEASRKPFKFSEIRFLPFRCPNCGWDLPYRPLSMLHLCPTCRRLWRERKGQWTAVDHEAIPPPQGQRWDELLWLPFWRFRTVLESSESRLETMADLYRLAPPPRLVDNARESQRPIYFYVPATRFRSPKAAHKLGSRLTFLQPEVSTEAFPEGLEPLAAGGGLTELDARELGPVILGEMIPPKNRRATAWLQGCQVKLQEPRILYFPFSRAHLYWKGPWAGFTFQHNALSEEIHENKDELPPTA